MSAARLYSLVNFKRVLAPYKCKLLFKRPPGFELWETGWGKAFTVRPDPPQMYSEDQLMRAIAFCGETMPEEWFGENGNGEGNGH